MPVQYSQRHSVINHSDRRSTHLGDLDISFVLLNIFSKFLLHLECYQGRIQDFKLGGAHLKKLRRAERGMKIFGVFRVKIHDFTQKKQITESPSYP